jgi:hypothetical protein
MYLIMRVVSEDPLTLEWVRVKRAGGDDPPLFYFREEQAREDMKLVAKQHGGHEYLLVKEKTLRVEV